MGQEGHDTWSKVASWIQPGAGNNNEKNVSEQTQSRISNTRSRSHTSHNMRSLHVDVPCDRSQYANQNGQSHANNRWNRRTWNWIFGIGGRKNDKEKDGSTKGFHKKCMKPSGYVLRVQAGMLGERHQYETG